MVQFAQIAWLQGGAWGAWAGAGLLLLDGLVRCGLVIRVIVRRTPVPDTLAWITLLIVVPGLSTGLYLLIGEHRLGTKRAAKFESITRDIETRAVTYWHRLGLDWTGAESTRLLAASAHDQHAPAPFGGPPAALPGHELVTITDEQAWGYTPMVRLLTQLSSMPALVGNHLELLGDAQQFFDRLIADIDSAQQHVHLLYYIWEDDAKGRLLADAVIRAAARGVTCRVLVDSVGSATLVESATWERMVKARVRIVEALPANPLRALFSRVDLRNHRKVGVIDGTIAYCGSQNITIENFVARDGKAGPWLDATVRMQGPAVQAMQATFLRDWVLDSGERLVDEEKYFGPVSRAGSSVVQVIPSGPGPRPDAIHQAFLAMMYAAREEILITTPYFVPDEATKGALINAALRGVQVTIVVPEVSDNPIVAAASRSHFEDLMESGVTIKLHQQGLLHSKAAVVDRSLAVIGSANFDQRSFWLNFEVTLFVYDCDFAGLLRFLQTSYMSQSKVVNPKTWRKRRVWQRFRDNCAQLLGPLL